jgi:hypothetical protein
MRISSILASILLIQASSAFACGHCIEDKIASVYDYATVSKAINQKHTVAFFGITGPLIANDDSKQKIKSMVEKINGIDSKSVRLSMDTASLSVAFDPTRITYVVLLDSLERNLVTKKLSIFPLDTVTTIPKIKVASK